MCMPKDTLALDAMGLSKVLLYSIPISPLSPLSFKNVRESFKMCYNALFKHEFTPHYQKFCILKDSLYHNSWTNKYQYFGRDFAL